MLSSNFLDEEMKGQFREDIKNVFEECGSDIEDIADQLISLHDFAIDSGLSENDWESLLCEVDSDISSLISFVKLAA